MVDMQGKEARARKKFRRQASCVLVLVQGRFTKAHAHTFMLPGTQQHCNKEHW